MSSDEERKNSKRFEAVGELYTPVGHDINNLLSGIFGYCDLLSSEHDAEHLQDHIEEISSTGKRIASLVRMLLVFTRKGIPRPEILDANEIIRETEKFILYLVGSETEFAVEKEPELWHVRADAAQLKRALLTLAIDIRDRMPEGGKFTLETKNIVLAPNSMQNGPDKSGNYVLITGIAAGAKKPSPHPSGQINLENAKHLNTKGGSGIHDVYEAIQICGGEIFLDYTAAHEMKVRLYFPAIA